MKTELSLQNCIQNCAKEPLPFTLDSEALEKQESGANFSLKGRVCACKSIFQNPTGDVTCFLLLSLSFPSGTPPKVCPSQSVFSQDEPPAAFSRLGHSDTTFSELPHLVPQGLVATAQRRGQLQPVRVGTVCRADKLPCRNSVRPLRVLS